jgi:hypothetical protein
LNISEYAYTVEQSDAPQVRRAALNEYRLFRRKALAYLHGDADTSVMNSVWNGISEIEKRPELLRRENFVCYNGLPYDHAAAYRRYAATLDLSSSGHTSWVTTTGTDAWGISHLLDQSFDALTGYPPKRKRLDKVSRIFWRR